MSSKQEAHKFIKPLAALAVTGFLLPITTAHAGPVWNVNLGNSSVSPSGANQITTVDNYLGAATENTANSVWNGISPTSGAIPSVVLADSTGSTSAGVTFQGSTTGGSLGSGGNILNPGDEIFFTWVKDDNNVEPIHFTFGNLSPGVTYSLVVYSDWTFDSGTGGMNINQIAGAGLTGTFVLNRYISASPANGTVGPLLQDTNPANVAATVSAQTNYARLDGLTPGALNTLGFSFGPANGPINGFQLIQTGTAAPDTTPPTPNPMSWLSVPAPASSSSITMTAATASDISGVEYSFVETSGNPGATNSGWQNSPTYTDTGLNPSTTYTYTVTARDKSPAQNSTTASAPASATTPSPDTTAPTPSPMTWATPPAPASTSSITMTATSASDISGVEYSFVETSGNPGATNSGWQNSPTYNDTGLNPSTTYTYTVTARDKSPAQNSTTASAPASATTPAPSISTVWNLSMNTEITTADNFIGAATENTANSTWNRITSVPQTSMVLATSTGVTSSGVSFDITGTNVNSQPLLSGEKIFNGWIGGAGATANMTLKGLTITNSYDLIIYSDWWWKNGDPYPVRQTAGSGLTGTLHINRLMSGTNGNVVAMTQDTNPANVASGSGNVGNWYRIEDLSPDANGHLSFLMGDGANSPFNGFQLIATPIPPRADILSFGLPSNPAVISGTNITLTLPFGSSVTSLAPTFTLWPGASCAPVSGSTRNFSSPQTYTVTSSDSLVTKVYTVSAVVAPPLPEFTLTSPATWDGRQTITVQPNISNLALLQANNGTNFTYQWSVAGVATTSQTTPGVLTLTRSQGSGPMIVTLTMNNGTANVTVSKTITVQEPAIDPWIERTPGANEKPVNGQFFARNPFTNLGTIFYRGTQSGTPDTVYLKIFKTPNGGSETLDSTLRQPLVSGAYAFSAPITAGLITYRVVYGTTSGGVDTDVATVTNLMCGDAYIIEGQSNAQATDNPEAQVDTSHPWIKTYNASLGWGPAYAKPTSPNWGSKVGFWGMKLAQDIVSQHSMPVCIINGAVGGTRIDEHQPNPVNRTVAGSLYSIYANLLNRVIAANLTHGIRGIFWHQGESDCSNFGPISDFDYTAYEQNFLNMSNAWKQDFPNFQRYIIYQVAPKPCNIGPVGDQLREVQRKLPFLYSKMSILNTLGIVGYDGCHFTKIGYESMAARMLPIVSRDFYGATPSAAVTAPNLKRAYFTSSAQTAIALEFDQAMSWSSFSENNYYINDVVADISSGSALGNIITLQLNNAAAANSTIDYLKDSIWAYTELSSSLLYGANGIPALTFADVPITSLATYGAWASSKNLNGLAAAADADPDNDGVENAIEFVLGGEPNPAAPGFNSTSLLPTSTRNLAGDLIFTFQRKTNSTAGVNLAFQWSSNLTFFAPNSITIGATSSTFDGVQVTITGIDSATDNIVITVPAAKAAGGKLFGRLNAVGL